MHRIKDRNKEQRRDVLVLRVISGSRRGAKLACLTGEAVRPTTDRVKENIFNLIQFDIQGKEVLDLFAGSGALGLEALSRGAKSAIFVEESPKAYGVLFKNVQALRFLKEATLFQKSFDPFLKTCSTQFDLVFLDPPYHKGFISRSLALLKNRGLLRPSALIVVECDGDEAPDFSGFSVLKERQYGRVKITLLQFDSNSTTYSKENP